MSNPEYIVFTDSELEHVRRSYFEQKRLGTEHSVALSKELLCRLIRNTMTNMISIARATEDSRYPSKHEVNAMAKRLVEYYPMIKDRSSSSNTEWVLDELRRIIQPTNSQYISEMKDRWEIFYSKVQFYGIMKKAMKPPKTLNGVEHAAAVFRALPLLFPSSTMPPRKLGANSEALFHVLTTSEDPDGFLHQRPLSCPVVVVSEDNCMIAIGSTPVATFDSGSPVSLPTNPDEHYQNMGGAGTPGGTSGSFAPPGHRGSDLHLAGHTPHSAHAPEGNGMCPGEVAVGMAGDRSLTANQLQDPPAPPQRSVPDLTEDPPPYTPPDPKMAYLIHPPPSPHYLGQPVIAYQPGPDQPPFYQPQFMPSPSYPPYTIYMSGPPPNQVQTPLPKDYLVESLLVTIFCCVMSGLIALMYSYETRAALARGDIREGERASQRARMLVMFSLLFGVFVCVGWIVYVVVAICA
ncbi:hypothetical protein AAFF_G00129920 [Aldrovandia affinis]|uniref:Uncharacterized protein n=2 Tax=Aldrovandia affinis TaxID=143900 RepID=A0AAD7RQZ6_9TELE|nr:hypothetical protein AAFF_G00129920 [Aldrovandia affinis]